MLSMWFHAPRELPPATFQIHEVETTHPVRMTQIPDHITDSNALLGSLANVSEWSKGVRWSHLLRSPPSLKAGLLAEIGTTICLPNMTTISQWPIVLTRVVIWRSFDHKMEWPTPRPTPWIIDKGPSWWINQTLNGHMSTYFLISFHHPHPQIQHGTYDPNKTWKRTPFETPVQS